MTCPGRVVPFLPRAAAGGSPLVPEVDRLKKQRWSCRQSVTAPALWPWGNGPSFTGL